MRNPYSDPTVGVIGRVATLSELHRSEKFTWCHSIYQGGSAGRGASVIIPIP